MFIVEGWLASNWGIDNRDKIIFIFEVITVGDNIPPFHMIGKEYFEVDVVGVVVDGWVDLMVFGAGVWGIFDLMKLDVGEILDDLYFLDLAVLLHDALDKEFVHLAESTDK